MIGSVNKSRIIASNKRTEIYFLPNIEKMNSFK